MTTLVRNPRLGLGQNMKFALQDLRAWNSRQIMIAIAVGLAFAVLIGVATVLIPNPIFARDIPPVWWNYPVWLITSALSGVLVATYIRGPLGCPSAPVEGKQNGNLASGEESAGKSSELATSAKSTGELSELATSAKSAGELSEQRTSRMGMAGGVLAWFAVGCPVCNKLALLALGYSGAITWFSPLQPFLAAGALALTGVAVVIRLRGQVACPVTGRILAVVK